MLEVSEQAEGVLKKLRIEFSEDVTAARLLQSEATKSSRKIVAPSVMKEEESTPVENLDELEGVRRHSLEVQGAPNTKCLLEEKGKKLENLVQISRTKSDPPSSSCRSENRRRRSTKRISRSPMSIFPGRSADIKRVAELLRNSLK